MNQAYTDREIVCVECGNTFVFTAGEQEYHASKGFSNEPKRCKPCRDERKKREGSGPRDRGTRQMHVGTCGQCGREARVPFKPRGDRPILCSSCFQSRR